MARIALVGYEPIVDYVTKRLPEAGHEVVSIDVVNERRVSLDVAVRAMLLTDPQVLHYTNFKDFDPPGSVVDRSYMLAVKKARPVLPIILTSCIYDAQMFALDAGIGYVDLQQGI